MERSTVATLLTVLTRRLTLPGGSQGIQIYAQVWCCLSSALMPQSLNEIVETKATRRCRWRR